MYGLRFEAPRVPTKDKGLVPAGVMLCATTTNTGQECRGSEVQGNAKSLERWSVGGGVASRLWA